MTPYFVKAKISMTPYMGDSEFFEDTRIVMADNMDSAVAKYQGYWDRQTIEYSTYYSIDDMDINETLL
jgi:hypothetical protein